MDPVTTALISKVLDGLTMRSEAIARNIANANSEGYRPIAVEFEQSLLEASRGSLADVASVEPTIVQSVSADGSAGTRLDLEMANGSQTALRYSALIDVLSRQIQIHHALVRGGQ